MSWPSYSTMLMRHPELLIWWNARVTQVHTETRTDRSEVWNSYLDTFTLNIEWWLNKNVSIYQENIIIAQISKLVFCMYLKMRSRFYTPMKISQIDTLRRKNIGPLAKLALRKQGLFGGTKRIFKMLLDLWSTETLSASLERSWPCFCSRVW